MGSMHEPRRGRTRQWGSRTRRGSTGLGLCVAAAAGIVALAGGAAGPAAKAPAQANILDIPLAQGPRTDLNLRTFAGKKALVVVFIGTKCPISNSYVEPLGRLSERYAAAGVQFIGVNANPGESAAETAAHAAEYRIAFPVFKDTSQKLTAALDAKVTPEAFVLDAGRQVRYRGRIDDAYVSRTQRQTKVGSHDLEKAIDAVLAGKPIAVTTTRAFGCGIVRESGQRIAANAVSFHRDIAPLMQEHCQSCHRPGQVAPFSLMTYADARSWANEIKEFTQSRQMPPWQAELGHGDFQDCRRLADGTIAKLAQWVDAGAPEGNPADAPAPKKWSTDWMLGKPDLVLTMPEPFTVAATGEDIFRCFVLPTGLAEDRQVVGVEVRPGNSRVLHHVLNFVDTTGNGRRLDAQSGGPGYDTGPGGIGFAPSGWMGGWAPGNFPRILPKGIGIPLPKNSDLVIQVHYHKTGKVETDQTQIGLYFAKEPIQQRLRVLPLTSFNINIPPGEARHEVKASVRLPFDMSAISIIPHMHLLGKEIKVTATLPDGKVKPMVYVKNWDYRWQDNYLYKEPLRLPRGTQLDLVAYYDNTAANPRNPNNPPRRVTFGEATTDEMCFAFINFVMDGERLATGAAR